jgi:uncharacterized protein (TIGR00369 family)
MKTENRDDYILLPNGGNHNCFGCSPRNKSGLQMKFCSSHRRDSVISWLTVPDHLCGWSNLVHGGIISTILDEAMGWAALVILKKLVVSKSITVEFIKPVLIGKEIKVEGFASKMNSEREAVLHGSIRNEDGELCARSSSLVSLFSSESIRKMGFVDHDMLGDMEQVMNIRLGREG